MNTTKQFWALLRIQMTINPWVWFLPTALSIPYFFHFKFVNLSVSIFKSVSGIFLIGIIGGNAIAPEITSTRTSGTEFLLTSAVDRAVLYRARSVFLYLLILVVPLLGLLQTMRNPVLILQEEPALARECLRLIPGATLAPNPDRLLENAPVVSLSWGNVLFGEWQVWVYTGSALVFQVVVLLVYPLKYRTPIYGIFYTFLLVAPDLPVFLEFAGTLPYVEQLFFFFVAHPAVCWMATLFMLILGEFWCERRFASVEH